MRRSFLSLLLVSIIGISSYCTVNLIAVAYSDCAMVNDMTPSFLDYIIIYGFALLPICVILLFFRIAVKAALSISVFWIIVLVLVAIGEKIGRTKLNYDMDAVRHQAALIVDAVERFHDNQGRYLKELREVFPSHIPIIYCGHHTVELEYISSETQETILSYRIGWNINKYVFNCTFRDILTVRLPDRAGGL